MKLRSLPARTLLYAGIAAACMALPAARAVAAPVDPTGTWLTEDGRARVRVEHCGQKQDHVCGFVVWMSDPHDAKGQLRKDESNPDHAKRGRLLLGHQLILGLKPNEDEHYEGQIYDAENGKLYNITLWRQAADELKIRGCMLSVLCGSQTWTATKDLAPGQLPGATGAPNGPRPDTEWAQEVPPKHPVAAVK
jgi:uncharacterized protein (DUF2147 family)